MIDSDPPPGRRRQEAARDADLRILPGEEPLEPQSVMHRHVDHATDGGGAIEIDGLTSDALEEVARPSAPRRSSDSR